MPAYEILRMDGLLIGEMVFWLTRRGSPVRVISRTTGVDLSLHQPRLANSWIDEVRAKDISARMTS